MLSWRVVYAFIKEFGLKWTYIPIIPGIIEQSLAMYGPFVYVCWYGPVQHTVLITGMDVTSRTINFNDPGNGSKNKPDNISHFFASYPPYFTGKEKGQTLIVYASTYSGGL